MVESGTTSLPYHEPDIVTILILTSFLLLSNFVNYALDRLLYCGLIGQILIGVAFGTPGGKWFDEDVETAIVQFGYLGLILLVYEGGLSTSFQSLKSNIILSIFVALTGICAPIGLSFTLAGTASATPLQSFAAGASLCSTSLGTTFTILGTTGLLKTRLGVVLTSAAMLDDVVGLVMVQVISNLSGSASNFSAITIVRPVFVSIGFAVASPLLCYLIVRPVTLKLNGIRQESSNGLTNRILSHDCVAIYFHSVLLIVMVTSATYAGTSNLFAAYLAGASISWWDSELPHLYSVPASEVRENGNGTESADLTQSSLNIKRGSQEGIAMYEKFYAPANNRILKPFFFTSIGFSIPITRMFDSSTLWRGVVYSILMVLGKLLCGAWLIRFSINLTQPVILHRLKSFNNIHLPHLWGRRAVNAKVARSEDDAKPHSATTNDSPNTKIVWRHNQPANDMITQAPDCEESTAQPRNSHQGDIAPSQPTPTSKPLSLYPAAILGLAMVARGEIGFLISSLSGSNGILSIDGDDQKFLIVTWAIVLCTLIGPVGVGLLVRRVRRLEKVKEDGIGGRDVLGVWGVE